MEWGSIEIRDKEGRHITTIKHSDLVKIEGFQEVIHALTHVRNIQTDLDRLLGE